MFRIIALTGLAALLAAATVPFAMPTVTRPMSAAKVM